jgi:hypothetical protein
VGWDLWEGLFCGVVLRSLSWGVIIYIYNIGFVLVGTRFGGWKIEGGRLSAFCLLLLGSWLYGREVAGRGVFTV